MLRSTVFAAAFAAAPSGAFAYSSYNAPMAPGNENMPLETGGFQGEVEKGLPTINVQYRFSPAKDSAERVLAERESSLAFDRRLNDAFREARADAAELRAAAGAVADHVSASGRRLAGASFLKQSPVAPGARIETATGGQFDGLNEVMRGMARAAHPVRAFSDKIDPSSAQQVHSCDRDYAAACPEGFTNSNGACVASSYNGACRSEVQNFSGWSLAAKVRWQRQCGAFWTCRSCTRDYSKRCPQGFESSGSECRATSAYDGPCRDPVNFSEYNAAMLKNWSAACGAYWDCA